MNTTITIEFERAIVTATRERYNPTSYDIWAAEIKPKNGGETMNVKTVGGLFDNGNDIAERAYKCWEIENK